MQTAHVINFADAPEGARYCRGEILRFVRGIRGPRENGVTTRQICKWLRATPDDFVHEQINDLITAGKIEPRMRSLSSGRRFNGVSVYTAIDN